MIAVFGVVSPGKTCPVSVFSMINPAFEKPPFSLTCHAKGRKASYRPYGQLRKNR
jgi:hypothetical protein